MFDKNLTDKYYQEGKQLFKAGSVDAAIQSFTKGMKEGDYRCAYYMAKKALANKIKNIDPSAIIKPFIEEIKKDAESGDKTANFIYGECLMNGLGLPEDPDDAFHYYENAAQQNHKTAICYCLNMAIAQNDKEKVFFYCDLGAKNNVATVINTRGYLYMIGLFYPKNFKQARMDFEKAASQDYWDAYGNLGYIYLMGFGVTIDYQKSKSYLEKAIAHDSAIGFINMGYLCLEGHGVEKNVEKAKEYFNKALDDAEMGGLAYNNLGAIAEREGDIEKAITCYEEAGIRNEALAFSNLGFLFLEGRGVKKDIDKALEYFKEGSESPINNFACFYNLGYLYSSGEYGIEPDYKYAKECYEKAAEYNFPLAYNELGLLYLLGNGVEEDDDKALEYFKKAAQLDSQEGAFNYALLSIALEQNYQEAYDYFVHNYKEKHHVDSGIELLEIYENGLGDVSPIKPVEAFKLANQLLKNDQLTDEQKGYLYKKLGSYYEMGFGIDNESFVNAIECYTMATKLGVSCSAIIESIESRRDITIALNNKMGLFALEINEHGGTFKEKSDLIKQRLIEEFPETWDKLLPDAQIDLLSGCRIYIENLAHESDIIRETDFSTVVSPILKAFEIEMSNFFFKNFTKYLIRKGITPEQALAQNSECQYVAYVNNKLMFAYGNTSYFPCTLGAFKYYANIKKYQSNGKFATSYQKDNNPTIKVDKYILEYAKEAFKEDAFPDNRNESITKFLYDFAEKTSDIAKKLRNPASHTEIMKYWDAIYCGEIIIMVEKLLHNFINKIKDEYLK